MTMLPPPPQPARNSPAAICSMILGILGATCMLPFGGIPAIILGHVALRAIRREAPALQGRGLAVTGLILGYLSLAAMALLVVLIIVQLGAGVVFGKYALDYFNSSGDCDNLARAVESYHREYGHYPPGGETHGDADITFSDDNAILLDTLRGLDGEKNPANPRGIVFFRPFDAFPFGRKSSFESNGGFLDPWGHPYRIRIDTSGDGKILNPYNIHAGPVWLEEKAIAWSLGPETFLSRQGDNDLAGRPRSWHPELDKPDATPEPTKEEPSKEPESFEKEK